MNLVFADSSSGIGAFNINLKAFVFQLLTFLIVLAVFKRWILPPINKTIEQRRKTLEESLEQARLTKESLANAEQRVEKMLTEGRSKADKVLAEAKDEAKGLITQAEESARVHGERIINESQAQLDHAKNQIREELKQELGDLVVSTTEKVLRQKLTAQADMELIKRSIKELK